jgi:hypothetical protein
MIATVLDCNATGMKVMMGKPARSRRVWSRGNLTAARAEEISNAKIINRVTQATVSLRTHEKHKNHKNHEMQSLVDLICWTPNTILAQPCTCPIRKEQARVTVTMDPILVLAPLLDFYTSLLQLSCSRILFKYSSIGRKNSWQSIPSP